MTQAGTTTMSDLLDTVLDSYGGRERWNEPCAGRSRERRLEADSSCRHTVTVASFTIPSCCLRPPQRAAHDVGRAPALRFRRPRTYRFEITIRAGGVSRPGSVTTARVPTLIAEELTRDVIAVAGDDAVGGRVTVPQIDCGKGEAVADVHGGHARDGEQAAGTGDQRE
jgi:hypothetical protein